MTEGRSLAQRLLSNRTASTRQDAVRAGVIPRSVLAHPDIKAVQEILDLGDALGLGSLYFQPNRPLPSGYIETASGRHKLNFSSFDYLGLSQHPEVFASAIEAVRRYGTSVSAARIVGGEIDLYSQLETALGSILGYETSLTFVSGYLTNLAFLGYVLAKSDLVILDELSHNSLITGARLSGAQRLTFRHNDVKHLRVLLRKHRATAEASLIVIESIYSMDGDIAFLPEILETATEFHSQVYVDEAHSLGVLGQHGRGVIEHYQLDPNPDLIIMGTLSKALAGLGGFVATDSTLLQAVRYQAPGASLYCTAMSPGSAAATLTALSLLVNNPSAVHELRRKSEVFGSLLREAGVNTGLSAGTPIIPIVTGSSLHAIRLSRDLSDNGIIAHAIFHPVVPEHMARVRLFVSNAHTEADLREAAKTIIRCVERLGVLR